MMRRIEGDEDDVIIDEEDKDEEKDPIEDGKSGRRRSNVMEILTTAGSCRCTRTYTFGSRRCTCTYTLYNPLIQQNNHNVNILDFYDQDFSQMENAECQICD